MASHLLGLVVACAVRAADYGCRRPVAAPRLLKRTTDFAQSTPDVRKSTKQNSPPLGNEHQPAAYEKSNHIGTSERNEEKHQSLPDKTKTAVQTLLLRRQR